MTRQIRNRRRASAGFTLTELIVTLAVASILLGIAVPSFGSMMMSSRLTTQANDFVSAINFARSEAIKRNRTISLCRTTSASATACATSAAVWQHWIIRTGAGDVIRRGRVETFGNSLQVSSTLTNDQVAFGSDGLARTGTGLVADHQIRVCIASSGSANIRNVVMGAGSRLSTQTATGAC